VIPLARLVEALGGTCERLAGSGPRIAGVQLDSRSVGAGDLFAALPGRAADGARFAGDALARGAAAILSPARILPEPTVPVWVHRDARRVAGRAAAILYGEPARGMFVVAVTGTNGKTTTAHLAGSLLARCGRRPAVLGTAGHRLADGVLLRATHTTPDAPEIQRLLARHRSLGGDSVALEASSHALEQERLAGLDVSVAVFTNLTRDHLDYHGDLERYAAAKERLFAGLRRGAFAVINADDPHAERMASAARAAGAALVRYGTRSRADLRASRPRTGSSGTRFTVQGMGISRTRVFLPLVGRFNVENALAALAAVILSGASPSDASEGLASIPPPPGRLEPVASAGRGFALFVDYAHTEDALRQVLGALRDVLDHEASGRGDHGGRLIAVFGCGGDRDRGKRAPMGAAARELADIAVVTSDNPRGEDPLAIVGEILAGIGDPRAGAEVVVEPDRRAAIRRAVELARPGDVVLVAGKGHETTQVCGAQARAFDDRLVAAQALAELRPKPVGGRS
jgi:UDP-N-acetylmuramoyl-L-alanyl-D-glutamate--2,6-diaminopimelate ligase